MVSKTHPNETVAHVRTIRLFSGAFRFSWAFVLFLTIATELLPAAPVPAHIFYTYKAWKGLLFVLLGFLTPLAFWSFDSIGFGLLFSAVAAGSVEMLQSFSPGHRASWMEFGAKLVVLFMGFALALNTRYNGVVRVGPFHRHLVNPHQKD